MSHFDHIQIQTTQNVSLRYEVSAIGDRLLAFIIDSVIVYGMAGIIALIYNYTMGFNGETSMIIGILLCVLPLAFYHVIMEIFNNGQSIGKKIMKIRVIRMDGSEPTIGNYVIRWLSRILEMTGIFGLALIVILINGKGQRLGDLAGGTTVAKVKKRVSLQDTILAFGSENYNPVYVMAKTLSGRDIETIKEALYFYRQYQNFNILNACGMKVKSLFGIDPNKDFTPNDVFLENVVNDYTYFKSLDENVIGK
jgi:uncharacterized RDD family membrane protein YckC